MDPQILLDVLDGIATQFYATKGILGVIATIVLIVHMSQIWDTVHRWSQRLRYISLLYFSVLITGVSADQFNSRVTVIEWKNIGAMGGVILLAVAAVTSLVAGIHDRRDGTSESERPNQFSH